MPWDFTVTRGRRAGEKTTTYDFNKSPAPKADEHGLYSTRFTLPPEWKDQRMRLVFEGVMTVAEEKVNGKSAGPVHRGGFYRFRHDITRLLIPEHENLLEVEVSKVSADALTERG